MLQNITDTPAMEATVAQIVRAFGRPLEVGLVRRVFQYGWHRERESVQVRYGTRARRIGGRGLDGALAALDLDYRQEKRVLEQHQALRWPPAPSPLPFAITKELRLTLRWMRRYDRNAFPAAMDAILGRELQAAE